MEDFTNEIKKELAKILASVPLSGSAVLSDFLSFIVNETLEGRGPVLKEYTIGVKALKKEPDFNPQIDGIVRIHAGRLRKALKEYYYEEGLHDDVIISIPKGRYVPVFEVRPKKNNFLQSASYASHEYELKLPLANSKEQASDSNNFSSLPSIAVLPFKKVGQSDSMDDFANILGDFLSTELTRFDTIKVISYYTDNFTTSTFPGARKIGAEFHAEYLLTGTVQFYNDQLRILMQITVSETGDQLWARSFDKKQTEELWAFQENTVEKVLGIIAGINGIITKHQLSKIRWPDQPDIHVLIYWYIEYLKNYNFEVINKGKQFYRGVLDKEPNNALAMSFLSEILAGESFLKGEDTYSNEGRYYASLAIKINPQCQQAYQALAIHLFFERNMKKCIAVLEQGLDINPKSADFKGAMGSLLIFFGEFERGIAILNSAFKVNPYLPWWHLLSYTFYSYYKHDYENEILLLERVDISVPWIPILKAATYAQIGDLLKAKSYINEINERYPDIALTKSGLQKMFFSDELLQEVLVGLSHALGDSNHVTIDAVKATT